MSAPILSLCIPTFSRARYLASLLESLCTELADFPYTFEVFVSDNASTDDTEAVVARYADRLPIRYHRHEKNAGAFANRQFAMSNCLGRYVLYIADDDALLGRQLADTIARMEADPEIAVVYAPWMLYDLVDEQSLGTFYTVPRDLLFERGQHLEMLDQLLRHRVFPEVQIVRRDVFERTMPRIYTHAFFAFVHAAEFLSAGRVLIQQEPFYVAITRYFADEVRTQAGTEEVEYAWDRYRGGLEYLLARTEGVKQDEMVGLHARINAMIADRMAVAIRIRHAYSRNPVDTWTIAMRLRGMGYAHLCPVPFETLSAAASMHFLLHDEELHLGLARMAAVGHFVGPVRDYIETHASRPVTFVDALADTDTLSNTLVLLRDESGLDEDPVLEQSMRGRNVRIVRERDVLERFRP
jgi:poly(ribitol-phosphate) beta-N-acetylglucosaminyltransferase